MSSETAWARMEAAESAVRDAELANPQSISPAVRYVKGSQIQAWLLSAADVRPLLNVVEAGKRRDVAYVRLRNAHRPDIASRHTRISLCEQEADAAERAYTEALTAWENLP